MHFEHIRWVGAITDIVYRVVNEIGWAEMRILVVSTIGLGRWDGILTERRH
jgi:hypothetical protein